MKQKILMLQTFILTGGTLFAWYQWYLEYFKDCKTCLGEKQFISKCFLGAIFFTLALILNLIIVTHKK